MALQRNVAERWQQAMGAPLVEGYGLTEASPNLCANPPDAREFSGTLGFPLPATEIALMDEEGRPLPAGEVGEICARGAQVMRGYWNAPEETARAFFPGGWLRTGDLGRIDERGQVQFVERRKDVIVVSGFKAYPSEIEAAALAHPGVKDAGAVGVPQRRAGEAVALFVVKRDPGLTAEALAEHLARHLAPYKRPVRIEFRDSLPKSPLGKVLHRELKAGGFARASIRTRVDPAVKTVPPAAVVTFAGVTKVFVIEGDKAKAVEVKLGTRDKDWVEVIGELPAGATVATSGHSQLVDGSPVKLRE